MSIKFVLYCIVVVKFVPHLQNDYFSLLNQSDHCFLALFLQLPSSLLKLPNCSCLPPCLSSLFKLMKRRLGAGESSMDGYVKSVADDSHGILRLLHKVKHFIYVKMLVEY